MPRPLHLRAVPFRRPRRAGHREEPEVRMPPHHHRQEGVGRHDVTPFRQAVEQETEDMKHVSKKAPYGSRLKNRCEYESWRGMIERCTNPRHQSYKVYGGAGVQVCDRWRSFESFLEDMGKRPDGTSLDRINGWCGYSPENCRWATKIEQFENSSSHSPTDVGQRFGRLVTTGEFGLNGNSSGKKRTVLCICDCGEKRFIRINNLRCGGTKSCGCQRKESIIKRNKGIT